MEEMTALQRKWQEEFAEEERQKAAELEKALTPEKLTENIRDMIPKPTGWRLVVLPFRPAKKTKGGILLAEQVVEKQNVATVCGYVLSVGPLAYADSEKFPDGPWCKEGDWVVFARYAGARINIEGGEIRILNDDEILALVRDPEDIIHMV